MSPQTRTVALRSGGTITLEVDAEWLSITEDDFAFVRSLIAAIETYETSSDEPVVDGVPPPVEPVRPAPTHPGRKLKLSAEVLAKVAKFANQAINDCRDPGPAVAEALDIKPISASMYMAEARRRGHTIPAERPCRHCRRPFALRGVATHERTCTNRYASSEVAKPEPTQVSAPEPAPAPSKLADEIAALRARDRAERDAKGRSAITDPGDGEPVGRVVWTCGDCGEKFPRKRDLIGHVDEHGRSGLLTHEEIGAIA